VSDAIIAVATTASPYDSRAQVRTADHTTRYSRIGTGRPVLVLDAQGFAATLWLELIERLAQHHRVIVPEVPVAEPRFSAWLRGFVEGMGLPPMTLVAAGDLCLRSLEYALLDPERIERLVLVPSGGGDETGLAGVLTPSVGAADIAILILRRDCAAAEAIPALERFLRGEPS
jgi:pimeloyl-ACP methyl ester carboxylesterase